MDDGSIGACTDPTVPILPQTHAYGLVGKLLSYKETRSSPKAIAAIMDEIAALAECGTWDEQFEEYDDIVQRARREKQTVHIGEGLGICTVKNSEMPEDQQRWKGRFCFRAPAARDEGAL